MLADLTGNWKNATSELADARRAEALLASLFHIEPTQTASIGAYQGAPEGGHWFYRAKEHLVRFYGVYGNEEEKALVTALHDKLQEKLDGIDTQGRHFFDPTPHNGFYNIEISLEDLEFLAAHHIDVDLNALTKEKADAQLDSLKAISGTNSWKRGEMHEPHDIALAMDANFLFIGEGQVDEAIYEALSPGIKTFAQKYDLGNHLALRGFVNTNSSVSVQDARVLVHAANEQELERVVNTITTHADEFRNIMKEALLAAKPDHFLAYYVSRSQLDVAELFAQFEEPFLGKLKKDGVEVRAFIEQRDTPGSKLRVLADSHPNMRAFLDHLIQLTHEEADPHDKALFASLLKQIATHAPALSGYINERQADITRPGSAVAGDLEAATGSPELGK